MQDIKKLFFIMLLFCISELYAYDYPWEVEYEIKSDSLEYINRSVQNLINVKTELQVYELDWDMYKKNEPNGQELGIKNKYYKLSLERSEYVPYGKVLQGDIYLTDVNTVVHFYIPYVKGRNKYYIRLVSYCQSLEKNGKKICGMPGKYVSFNDVEPTKIEIPIKKSFEKNFLDILPFEWTYVEPASIDKRISKILSFFRKRKNFSDE